MPVDYTAYLLSSSPPGTGLEFLSSSIFEHLTSAERSFVSHAPIYIEQRKARKVPDLPKPIITSPVGSRNSSEPTSPVCNSPCSPTSPSKPRKKVSFADSYGYELATIRIMTEPSEIPPLVRPEILSNLTKGASASVTSVPPLSLSFTQPAADYLAFRDRLEKNCVSLENVILKDYEVRGTIKVKNLAYEKHVVVRYTFDSWETSNEIVATYSHSNNRYSNYDTFMFVMDVPTDFNTNKQVQFAVCYRPSGRPEYWDNNDNKNYTIVSSKQNEKEMSLLTDNFSKLEVDSTFACWRHIDRTVPYWWMSSSTCKLVDGFFFSTGVCFRELETNFQLAKHICFSNQSWLLL